MPAQLPASTEVLKYKCDAALAIFRRKFLVSSTDADELWQDTLLWLWLGKFHEIDKNPKKPDLLVIFPQILSIDEMWHAFILCTREYHDFCQRYFGGYIHHAPNADPGHVLSSDHFRSNVDYVSNVLGKHIAMRWYLSLPIIFENAIEHPQLTPAEHKSL
ncbi:hypothetical protein ACBI01_002521 [Aeromonas veronii]